MYDPALVLLSIPCTSCRYDLRGLSVDGKCPECGSPVSKSVPRCPRCSTGECGPVALIPHGSHKPGVWDCRQCQGLGFDPGQLRSALDGSRLPPTSFHLKPVDFTSQLPVSCGRCVKPTRQVAVDAGVLIDRCDECGFVWLDAGEFPAVAAYVSRIAGTDRLPSDMEKLLHDPEEFKRRLSSTDYKDGVTASVVEVVIYGIIFGLFG